MLKKLFMSLVILGATQSVLFARLEIRRFTSALEESDLEQVKALLRKVEREETTFLEKKAFYQKLSDLAADVVDEKRSKISVSGDWRDLLQAAIGSFSIIGGLCSIAFGMTSNSDDDIVLAAVPRPTGERSPNANVLMGGGVFLSAIGIILAYRGFSCKAQNNSLAQAIEIENYMESKLSALEEEVAEEAK